MKSLLTYLITFSFLFTSVYPLHAQVPVRYVKTSGSYANDGTSWDKAKNNLQDAIEDLRDYMTRNGITEGHVYVAAGTYRPTTSTPGGEGVLYTSFLIYEGITLYGGFNADNPESSPELRLLEDDTPMGEAKGTKWKLKNETVLSGNHSASTADPLAWNSSKNGYDEAFTGNSYHVVWFATNTETYPSGLDGRNRAVGLAHPAAVDGFTIRDGSASNRVIPEKDDGSHANHNSYGGGVYMVAGSEVRNCIITQNASSLRGGGVYMDGGGLLEQSYVGRNQSGGVGVTDGYGGGVACDDGGIVRHCVIENNSARCGGGMSLVFTSQPSDDKARYASYAAGCVVNNNTSSAEAGGVFMRNGGLLNHLTITYNNCVGSGIVYNNRRYGRSGGLYADGGGMVANTVIWGNEVKANNNVQYATYRESMSTPKVKFDFVALSRHNYVDWSGTVKRANGVYSLDEENSDAVNDGFYPAFEVETASPLPATTGVLATDDAHTAWIPRAVSYLRHRGLQFNDYPNGSGYETQGSVIADAHVATDINGGSFAPRCVLGAMVARSPKGAYASLPSIEDKTKPVMTIFVDPSSDAFNSNHSDKGGTWETAFHYLNDALDYVKTLTVTADNPVQIVVKEGTVTTAGNTYMPNIRTSFIDMPSHVRLYGSFAAQLTGTSLDLRDPMEYSTRITANVTGGEYRDNGCHVITVRYGATDVIVDGFQLYFANAVPNSVMPALVMDGGGGIAVINDGNAPGAAPMENIVVRNCVMANCTASHGSALYLLNTLGTKMEVSVENCIFHNNAVTKEGSAAVEAAGSNVLLTLNHCLVRGNVGYGVAAHDNAVIKVKNTALHANVRYGGSSSENLKISDLSATETSPDSRVVTFVASAGGTIGVADGASVANNMMDMGVTDVVSAAVATAKFSYLSSDANNAFPGFVNPTSNIGVNRDGDVTTYGGDPEWMPTNMNPMVNAATDASMSGTDLTGDTRDYGGAADIGAVENSDQPEYGTVIYVRDYRNADGTIDTSRDGDGSSWQKAINGNLESEKYTNNHGFGGVDAEIYDEGYQLTGLQWAVDEAFARSLERNDNGSVKYTTITGVTHFNPGGQGNFDMDRTTIAVSKVNHSKCVQVWIGEGEYIRREGFFMRDAVDVYGGFPGKGGSPMSPGMKERVPKTSILETLTNDEVTEDGVKGTGEWGPQVDDYAHKALSAYQGVSSNSWSVVDFSSDDKEGNAAACIDENNSTFWHSRWQSDALGHGTQNGGLPQWIIIDMGQTYDITALKVINRNYTPNNYTIGYAAKYTDDNRPQFVNEKNFTLIWDKKGVTAATEQTLGFGTTITCRYLYVKVNSNTSGVNHVDIKEIAAYNGSARITHVTTGAQNNVYDLNSYKKAYKSRRVLTQPYPYFKGTVQIDGKTSGQNLEFDNDPFNPFSVVTSWDGFTIRNGRTKITHQRDGGAGVALRINGRLANCVITNNVLSSSKNTRGAGIFQNGGIIENCEIDGNILIGDGNVFGGGLYQRTGTVFNTSVIKNKITGSGDCQGTGVFFENGRFYNNTITANVGPYTLYSGKWFSNGRIDVYNSIIYGNEVTKGQEFDCTTDAGNITLKNCLFENSSAHKSFDGTYINVDASSFVYMEDKQPSDLFENPDEGDYNLKAGAMAINKGTDQLGMNMEETAPIVLPSYDANYANRIQDCTVDIGAYEFNGAYSITPDVTTSADEAVFYVTQYGRGTGSAANPDNAACWTKLQKVLDAAGRYLENNSATKRKVIVKLAGDAPTETVGADGKISYKYTGFVYRPRRSNKDEGQEVNVRDYSFIIPHGVEVWGGYSSAFTSSDDNGFFTKNADGTYTDKRDVLKNRTSLSGIYQTDGQNVNVYNVVTFTNDTYTEDESLKTEEALSKVSSRAVLDGLFIEDGNADGDKHQTGERSDTRVGGGAIVTGYAHIRNCIVQNNKAADAGGGLYLEDGALVSGSIVQYNEVTKGDGGGIYVQKPAAAEGDVAGNPARIFTSDVIYNTASGAGGGISFTTDAAPNVRANSVLFWQNVGSEQSNVSGMTIPSDVDAANLTIDDYPISFCATETTREPGINNITVKTDVEKGVRFDEENYNHNYTDDNGQTVTRMHNAYEFYKIKKYSLLARGGMENSDYEKLINAGLLIASDLTGTNRMFEGNDFIDIGARAIGDLVLPPVAEDNLMTRLFVVNSEEEVDPVSVEVMQNQDDSEYYKQEGSSFAYPMRYLSDALQYVREARKQKDGDDYKYKDRNFQIILSGGTYYPIRNVRGEYVNSRGRTFLVPEGVSIVGGVATKQTDGSGDSYYGNVQRDKNGETIEDAPNEEFEYSGNRVVLSHPTIKDIVEDRKLADVNNNSVAEPWEMAVQTILSGQVVSNNTAENVYHVIVCIADEDYVGGLPPATRSVANGDYDEGKVKEGKMPYYRGEPIVIDGVIIEDGAAMGYDETAVNNVNTYYKGGAICVEGNWTTGGVIKNEDVLRSVGYRNIPLEVRNCNFRNNGGCIGGAIFTDCELKVFACNFVQNYVEVRTEEVVTKKDGTGEDARVSVTREGRGGAIHARYNTMIANSLLANNEAAPDAAQPGDNNMHGIGGAILVGEYSSLNMINCDVVRNKAYGFPAVYCYAPNKGGTSSDANLADNNLNKIVNSIIWGNEATSSDSGLNRVVNFDKDASDESKNAEMLWFSAYEEGWGNEPVSTTNGIDYRLQAYPGFGTFIPSLWTGGYNVLQSDNVTISKVDESNPDTDASTGLNPVTCNIIIDSDNGAINGPNFINPSSKAGRAGYYTSADWRIGRVNNLVDNGWTYLQQDLTGDEPKFVYEDVTDNGSTRSQAKGAGIYLRTVYAYDNVNTGKTALPIGDDVYMNYSDGSGAKMLRISTDPNPTHNQTYIDLGVYEYQHVKLTPDVENGHVDVLWVTQMENTGGLVADGKTWETATSDMQRAIETLLASRNGHDKEIRMLEGLYQPVYTINGNLGFTVTTDINTGVVPPLSGTEGVNSLTIRGGYSKDVKGLVNVHDYPVYLIASERAGVDKNQLGHVFVIGDVRQRLSSGSGSDVATEVKDYAVPVYMDGLTFSNVKAEQHENGGAAVYYKDQTAGEGNLVGKTYVPNEVHDDAQYQYAISGDDTGNPLYKLTLSRCDFRINGSTGDVPAVTIGKGGGEALIYNSLFHSNMGNPLVATDTKVVNCTFALNGGKVEFKDNVQGKSEMHNSILWRNNGDGANPEWTGLVNVGDNAVMTYNAISSLETDDVVYNNSSLSRTNGDVLQGPNFFNPVLDAAGSWDKADRDFRVNPSAKIVGKASPKKYVELVKNLTGRYPYKSTSGASDADYEDLVKQDLDLAANTRYYGTAGLERGAYECIAALSRVLYVNPERVSSDASYTGFSWEKAYAKGNLQTAIDAAAVYSNINNEKSYVFVKGMAASTGEAVSMRDNVTLYGSLPSTTAINQGVKETVNPETGEKYYADEDIEAYIKAMDSDREGMASTYSKHTIVEGVSATDDMSFCLFDGLEIGSGSNSESLGQTAPAVDMQKGNVALRNSIIANNRMTVPGQPLVSVKSGLLYNTLMRDNTMAATSDAIVTIGDNGYMLNCTVAGKPGQTLVSGLHSIKNSIMYNEGDEAMPFAPYFRPSATAYHNEIPETDLHNRNLWYQLHERTPNIEGGDNGATINAEGRYDGKGLVAADLQQYVDFASDRDLLGNPRVVGDKVDNGCFETWSTGTHASPSTIHADTATASYNGHHYPHEWSVVYLQTGGNLVCDVADNDKAPHFTAGNPLRPGYLIAMEGGSLYGQGNSIRLRYVAAERTVGGQYALVSLPFDMNYKAVEGRMPFVTATTYEALPGDAVSETAVDAFSRYYYDGEARSNYKYNFSSDDSQCWKNLTEDLRDANDGILVDRGADAASEVLRFTAYGETATTYPYQEDGDDKTVILTQYDDRESTGGAADFTSVYNMGWNLKGMPYLISDYRLYEAMPAGGAYAMNVPHVIYTMNDEGNYSSLQSWGDGSTLSPCNAFFTQTSVLGPEENLRFAVPAFTETAAPALQRPVLNVYGAGYGQDEVVIMPSPDEGGLDYVYGNDAVKMSALNDTLPQISVEGASGVGLSLLSHAPVGQSIPLSVSVKGEGDYTFSLPFKDDFLAYGSVLLKDSSSGAEVDLMSTDYTASITQADSPARFSLIIGGSPSDGHPSFKRGVYTVGGVHLDRPNGQGIFIIDGKRRVVK